MIHNCSIHSTSGREMFAALQPLFDANILQRETTFQLPDHFTIPNKDYKQIAANIYSPSAKKVLKVEDVYRCDCTPTSKCGVSCSNRSIQQECNSECPCKDNCQNRKIQNGLSLALKQFRTLEKGYGLKTLQSIAKNEFIIEYVGEVLTKNEYQRRTENSNDKNSFFMEFHQNLLIDASKKGNLSRFINHSCDPNCEIVKWMVDGKLRMVLTSTKAIQPGEELSYNYNWDAYSASIKCNCKATNCKESFTGPSTIPFEPRIKQLSKYRIPKLKEVKKLYSTIFLPFLLQQIFS